jgi:hypothetical protein
MSFSSCGNALNIAAEGEDGSMPSPQGPDTWQDTAHTEILIPDLNWPIKLNLNVLLVAVVKVWSQLLISL